MLIVLTFFSLIVLISLWICQIYFTHDIYKATKKKELLNNTNEISGCIDGDFVDVAKKIAGQYSISVVILESDGNILFEEYTSISYVKSLNSEDLKQLASLADEGKMHYIDMVHYDYEKIDDYYPESLIYINKVQKSDGQTVTLIVSKTITKIQTIVNTTRTQLVIVSCLITICTIFMTVTLTLKIVRPIESVTLSATELAKGEIDVKFEGSGYYEIEKLRDTLNYASNYLSKTEQYRRELYANVSHDIRTPLTLINGFAQLMKDYPDEITVDNIQIIIDETDRLNALVNDILSITKLKDGKDYVRLNKFDIVPLLKNIVSRISAMLQTQGLTIDLYHDEKAIVLADESKIAQVVYNLISNAVNYAGPDKKIIVRQTIKDKKVRVEIIDHGKGMDEAELRQIWDKYYKSDKNHRRFHVGTGLGLSIVKNIISMHPGAAYGVKSGIDKGSKFYFTLPKINE